MKLRPYSATVLTLGGASLMGLGLYFIFLRPPVLPEDLRYMGSSLAELQVAWPGLAAWLRRVFWVMGGYMFATGWLTAYVALTAFRTRARAAVGVVVVAGLASIGWMAGVNFIIGSDFKWLLLGFVLIWVLAVVLYWIEGAAQV
jgi:hypothetical protein